MPPPVVAELPERVESLTVSVPPGSLAMPAAIDGEVVGQGHVGERQSAGVVDAAAIAVEPPTVSALPPEIVRPVSEAVTPLRTWNTLVVPLPLIVRMLAGAVDRNWSVRIRQQERAAREGDRL